MSCRARWGRDGGATGHSTAPHSSRPCLTRRPLRSSTPRPLPAPSRRCEKALQDYLETKRIAFPRFYFVAPADLLDILSKGSNPQLILRHLPKCFDNVHNLTFRKVGGRWLAGVGRAAEVRQPAAGGAGVAKGVQGGAGDRQLAGKLRAGRRRRGAGGLGGEDGRLEVGGRAASGGWQAAGGRQGTRWGQASAA